MFQRLERAVQVAPASPMVLPASSPLEACPVPSSVCSYLHPSCHSSQRLRTPDFPELCGTGILTIWLVNLLPPGTGVREPCSGYLWLSKILNSKKSQNGSFPRVENKGQSAAVTGAPIWRPTSALLPSSRPPLGLGGVLSFFPPFRTGGNSFFVGGGGAGV